MRALLSAVRRSLVNSVSGAVHPVSLWCLGSPLPRGLQSRQTARLWTVYEPRPPQEQASPWLPSVPMVLMVSSHLCSLVVPSAPAACPDGVHLPSEAGPSVWASPALTVLTGLWRPLAGLDPAWPMLSVHACLCPESGWQSPSSREPFVPHHFINERPQNTSLVGYKIVCKANKEVINTLVSDRMRLPADGAWKVASPSLSFLAPGPASRPNLGRDCS